MSDLDYKFTEEYKRLNTHQKEAVDTIEGPVMVVAGPGTGKTQILTLRIANILKQTDTAPANILALTFTESAAANMRKRLATIVGSRAYQVVISTFHGFCNDVIKNYPEEFPRIIGSTNITEIDQIKIIEELLNKLPLKILRPFGDPLLYVKPILSSINELKREGLSPAEFTQIVVKKDKSFDQIPDLRHEKGAHKGKVKSMYEKLRRQIDKNLELVDVYTGYEEELTKRKFYDYSDMIMEVLRELRTNQTLLSSLQEEHQYILVDEHQDTNNAQNKVLELIASFHDYPNLFVVGDEKQAVFRFQGASLENFYYFKHRFPEAKLIVLEDNYRSTQAILDQAHSLLPGQAELKANTGHLAESIKVAVCSSPLSELYFVASSIKSQIASGVELSEIAVLYRDNRDAFPIANVLDKLGVPCVIESDDNLLADIDIRKLLILFKAIYYFDNDEALAQALHLDFLEVEPVEAYGLIRQASQSKQSLISLVGEKFPILAKQLSDWNVASHNLELLPLVEKVLKESKLLDRLVTSSTARKRLETIGVLFNTMSDLVASHPEAGLEDFLEFIETVNKHQVLLKNKSRASVVGKVRLMTVHRSKGLEFQSVFIIGAYDGHFGGRSSRDKLKLLSEIYQLVDRDKEGGEEDDKDTGDERRLFYVALTRAKQLVTISLSAISDSGREQVPSQFIAELKPELIEYVDTSGLTDKLAEVRETLLSPTPAKESDLKDREYIAGLFRDQGLSVTALNNYLACPWQYFYRNLIRLPAVPNKHQAYGIAVHAALRDAFKHAKERDITKESLLASFEKYLRQEPLTEKDLVETLAKGLESLSGWFDTYYQSWNINVLTEFNIKGVELTPDIKLVGMLDKIEFTGDGADVNVVDYKTGKPKSRNDLMGATRDADGNYYRQLVFYKILLDLFEDGKYKMMSGEIDFVEPNDTGKYKKEKFEIPDNDVIELTDMIKKVADEIINLKFWDKTCDDKDCEYCALRRLMT
jgi:DNA helicase-2/ATP-dependent DNA helicase PcrA